MRAALDRRTFEGIYNSVLAETGNVKEAEKAVTEAQLATVRASIRNNK